MISRWSTASSYLNANMILHTGGGGNFSYYSNKQVDSLIEESASEVDVAKVDEMLKNANTIAWEKVCTVLLYSADGIIPTRSYVKPIRNAVGAWEWDFSGWKKG